MVASGQSMVPMHLLCSTDHDIDSNYIYTFTYIHVAPSLIFFISCCLIHGTGLALQVESIDADKARAAACADTSAAASKSDTAAATMLAASSGLSAASDNAPSLLIHATRTGGRTIAPGPAVADRAAESGAESTTHISDLFKCTHALPVIYYQENERSMIKRRRTADQRV
jgi:hypothetical protein